MSSQAFFGTPHCVSLSLTLAKPLVLERSFVTEGESLLNGLLTDRESWEEELEGKLPSPTTVGTTVEKATGERLKSISPLAVLLPASGPLISDKMEEKHTEGMASSFA